MSKYLKTVLLFTELPMPSINKYTGFCTLATEPYTRIRPCSIDFNERFPNIRCDECVFSKDTSKYLRENIHAQ